MDAAAAAELHRKAIVVDGHVHITNAVLTQGIDPWQVQATGTFDYARARQGGLDVVVDHLFVEDGYTAYNYTVKQAVRLIETALRVLDAHPEKMELALTSADIRRIVGDGKLAIVLALEGGFDTEGDLDVLRLFHRLGVRMVQLTGHDTSNTIIDAYAGEAKWAGLSPHGRRVIEEMNRLGIVVDISHAPDHAKRQVIEVSRAPVVTSHNGLTQFADVIGNLPEGTLRALAEKGGLVGLHSAGWLISQRGAEWTARQSASAAQGAATPPARPVRDGPVDYGAFVDTLDDQMRDRWINRWGYGQPWRERHDAAAAAGAPMPTVDDWAEQIEWVVRLVGDSHVGLGLDLMAGGNWLRDFDATSYGRLTEALVARGLPESAIVKVLGENWLRVLDAAKAPQPS